MEKKLLKRKVYYEQILSRLIGIIVSVLVFIFVPVIT